MAIDISVAGVSYSVPSSAADTDWAASQIAWEQAVSAAATVSRKSVNVTPVGTGADTTEDNLMTYSLPAGTLSTNGMGVRITAWGTGVNTADTTTVRAYFGSTLLVGPALTANSTNSWRVVCEVFRTGATAQTAAGSLICTGSLATAKVTTPAETLSGAVTIKLTGQRASTSSANSIIQDGMIVELIS